MMRARQLRRAVVARGQEIGADERAEVNALLGDAAHLFFGLPRYEQRHALNVLHTLRGMADGTEQAVMQAALLHDVGKTNFADGRRVSVPIWLKVANVGLQKSVGLRRAQWLLVAIGGTNPHTWRYVFTLQATHEARGAEIVRAAGLDARVVALVDGYGQMAVAGDAGAQALQKADDLN